ncbi:MAG: hypothetical protein ACREBQ_01235, partial [Nitrososphaerales archaeon]
MVTFPGIGSYSRNSSSSAAESYKPEGTAAALARLYNQKGYADNRVSDAHKAHEAAKAAFDKEGPNATQASR